MFDKRPFFIQVIENYENIKPLETFIDSDKVITQGESTFQGELLTDFEVKIY